MWKIFDKAIDFILIKTIYGDIFLTDGCGFLF